MTARSRKKSLYVCAEATYSTDPSASGSLFLWVPADEIGDVADEFTILETGYQTGRNYPTASELGVDGWSLTTTSPMIGLLTAAGDNVNASTVTADWLDVMLAHTFGPVVTSVGEGVAASSTVSTLILDTDVYGVGDVAVVFEAGLPATGVRSQLAQITVDPATGSYTTVSPNFATAPTTAAVAYGTKGYRAATDAGGASIALHVIEDDRSLTLLGGRCTGLKMSAGVGKRARMEWTFSGDRIVAGTKGSLPAAGRGPATTAIKGVLSPVYFNGVSVGHCSNVDIDMGITAAPIESTEMATGRANYELISFAPSITVDPLRTQAAFDLKRNGTVGPVLVQFGAGALSGAILNLVAFAGAQGQATQVTTQAGNIIRNQLKIDLSDGGVTVPFLQVLRG